MAQYAVITTNKRKSSLCIINLGQKAMIMASGANYTRVASIIGETSKKDLALILMVARNIALKLNNNQYNIPNRKI